jgi:uncharacterized metal-binding protein YceD (DUF177 family)
VINIKSLLSSPNGTQETFEEHYEASDFPDCKLLKSVSIEGLLIRVEEGVSVLFEQIQSSEEVPCSRCGKALKLAIQITDTEWLFYEREPNEYDDKDELMLINRKQMELDPRDAIRQELILHHHETPHCDPECIEFKEPEKGKKSLAGLKEMWENTED